jgi:hypothetical protein
MSSHREGRGSRFGIAASIYDLTLSFCKILRFSIMAMDAISWKRVLKGARVIGCFDKEGNYVSLENPPRFKGRMVVIGQEAHIVLERCELSSPAHTCHESHTKDMLPKNLHKGSGKSPIADPATQMYARELDGRSLSTQCPNNSDRS